jgi:hypothetical protein
MMGKKTKRLYGRMQHGIQQKKDAVQALQDKQQRLEREKAAAGNSAKGKGKGQGAGPAAAKPAPAPRAKKAKKA